jgi:hypothetical protein
MFTIDTDKTISITRGDSGSFVAPINYAFQGGEVLRLKVFRKKACEDVVLQKDFVIAEATETVTLELTEKDTRIGGIISKPVDYWYEIELNPDNNPQTIVGYDEDGAKIFRLYPEGRDIENDEITEEEKTSLQKWVEEMLSKTPLQDVIKELDVEKEHSPNSVYSANVINEALLIIEQVYLEKDDIVQKLDIEEEFEENNVYSANVMNDALNEIANELDNIRTEFTDGLSSVSELIGGAEE